MSPRGVLETDPNVGMESECEAHFHFIHLQHEELAAHRHSAAAYFERIRSFAQPPPLPLVPPPKWLRRRAEWFTAGPRRVISGDDGVCNREPTSPSACRDLAKLHEKYWLNCVVDRPCPGSHRYYLLHSPMLKLRSGWSAGAQSSERCISPPEMSSPPRCSENCPSTKQVRHKRVVRM